MALYRRESVKGRPHWQVVIDQRDPETGARRRVVVGSFASKRDAEKAERDALAMRDRGTLVVPSRMTMRELLTSWLESKRGEIGSQAWVDSEIVVRKHLVPALGDVRVQALTASRIQAAYDAWRAAGESAWQVRGFHNRLSQALDRAERFGVIHANPCRAARPPRLEQKRVSVWNAAEAITFLDAAKDDGLHPLWHLLLLEGLRRGEGLGLRWRDVDLDTGAAVVVQTVVADKQNRGAALIQKRTKTNAGSRSVRLTQTTIEALKEHRKVQNARRLAAPEWEDHGLIVCTGRGTPVNPANVSRSLDRLRRTANLPEIRVHDLRHSSATLLLSAGIPIKIVSERLGHTKASVTIDLYQHVIGGMQDDAAAAIDRAITPRSKVS